MGSWGLLATGERSHSRNDAMGSGSARARHQAYWWMAGMSIVQRALNILWLAERGVPNLKEQWVQLHYGRQNLKVDPASVNLAGTA